mmetsp:Transcript_80526/g.167822  ORF Transcript_80526/g.167822 Transcript_80526/m.167822 type:complete len:110 (-) Transcript_80526:199-528(-)
MAGVGSGSVERTGGRGKASMLQDDIHSALEHYLETKPCGLHFRRLNRGWYGFARSDGAGGDRMVELSLVNNKLKARYEASSTDKGWNNGKFGDMDRFCKFAEQVQDEEE